MKNELLVLVVAMLKELGGEFQIKPGDAVYETDQEVIILTDPETLVTTIQLRDKQEVEADE